MSGQAVVEETRAMLALFAKSRWRDVYARAGGYEMFFARPDGAHNPMMNRASIPIEAGDDVPAPHLGLFFASLAPGALVDADTVIGQLEILGEREGVVAGRHGRLAAVLVADGALVEYATPLVRIAA